MSFYFLCFTFVISTLVSMSAYNFGIAAWVASDILFFMLFFSLFKENRKLVIFNVDFIDNEVVCLKSIMASFIIFIFYFACISTYRGEPFIITSLFAAIMFSALLSRGYRRQLFLRTCESETLNVLKKLFRAYQDRRPD